MVVTVQKEEKRLAKDEVRFVVTEEYKKWIEDIKQRVKQSQIKASVKVNYELLDLYWNFGKDIVNKQETSKWGESFLKVMSNDLKSAFPNMAGFSVENLKHIRYWYRFYSEDLKRLQLVTQFETWEKMIKSIPWGHNQRIVYKCKNIEEALFYVQKTIDNGWSRNVLIHQGTFKKDQR